jgi:hypothetical protein
MGGFVNASFFIKDGEKTLHLKLTDDGDSQINLVQWRDVSKRLTSRYHAPKMYGWVRIPRTSYEGALFQYFPGKPADLAHQPEVLQGVLSILPRLHSDQELAEAIGGEEDANCLDYFMDLYMERLDGDLVIVADQLPPFVTLEDLSWMMGESRELEALARDMPAFQAPLKAPTHGDLWSDNILVKEDGSWAIIDWDDLSLGDPAIEYSILLGPLWIDGVYSLKEIEGRLPRYSDDPGMRDRFSLGLRALALDQVIDTLADWIEAEYTPFQVDEVRAIKEQKYHKALSFYREHYK